ncbi:hypothetical protein DP939_39225 [Spongiactinospora rosea]|uniref:Bacterial Pleckstrin homology domain-containing protein n=1 Tax=Spongiactinospora rosea TaxID=2248750 RepID=A0A366LMB8_9ACTN|nr:hypothetical protein [Spongiactinospora rosea]RBQ14643.1 hypothetical protein DP939_39225 [Spongiactinospora rosea]
MMLHVEIHQDTLTVRFAPWARLFTRTGTVSVPLTEIAEVRLIDRPLKVAKGTYRGLLVSGVVKIGTWTSPSGVKRLTAARRDVGGLQIILKSPMAGHDELVLSVPDAEPLRRRLLAVPA